MGIEASRWRTTWRSENKDKRVEDDLDLQPGCLINSHLRAGIELLHNVCQKVPEIS